MDPASIVSIISFGGACSSILIRGIYAVQQAPTEILSLHNEVTDLNALLSELKDNVSDNQIQQHGGLQLTRAILDNLATIQKRYGDLADLSAALYRVAPDGKYHFQRVQWMKKKSKVTQLQKQLTSSREALRDLLRLRHGKTLDKIELRLASMENLMTTVPYRSQLSSRDVAASAGLGSNASTSSIALTAYTRPQCNLECACSCHYRYRLSTPAAINAVLGQIFVGYVGLPTPGANCDTNACSASEAKSVRLAYVFPSWFISRSFTIAIGSDFFGSPEVRLRVRNRRDYTSEHSIFQLARQGRIEKMKDVLSSKTYTPCDVSTRGGSTPFGWALQHASTTGRLDACQLLIDAGADLDIQNDYGTTDLMNATQMSFLTKDRAFAQRLMSILGVADASELWAFSRLHEIVLDILPLDLGEQLQKLAHFRHIDLVDIQGKTALHWAAHKGNAAAVRALLVAGADARLLDIEQRSALHYAVISGNVDCVDLLIIAKTDVNAEDRSGDAPILMAAWGSDNPSIVHSLVHAGACVMSRNPGEVTGLQSACCLNHVGNIKAFVALGADINAHDRHGDTPLFETIIYNNIEALEMILTMKPDMHHRNEPGWTVLHVLALHGSVASLQRLEPFLPCDLVDVTDQKERTARQALDDRVDSDSEFLVAFEMLLQRLHDEADESSDAYDSASEYPVP